MAYNWKSIDGNFPAFTGKESPSQQIRALHDYLFQMREALQFSLSNLSADNFNAEALKNLSESQSEGVAEELKKIADMFSTLSEEVGRLRGSIQDTSDLVNRVGDLQDDVNGENGLQERLSALNEIINGEDGLLKQAEELSDMLTGEDGLQAKLESLTEAVTGEDGLQMQIENANSQLEMIAVAVCVQEDGSVILGAPGQRIELVGDIYINGVLYAEGETE